jgi:hypothetical protein
MCVGAQDQLMLESLVQFEGSLCMDLGSILYHK